MFNLITDWVIETPKPYGIFHLVSFALMIVFSIIFGLYAKKRNDNKTVDKVVFRFGLMLLIIEIYKQIFFTIVYEGYQFYAFPFQFCSVPMYVCLVAPLIKKEKLKTAFYNFLCIYGLLAGLMVMLIPTTVFISYVTIDIHTMLWHGSMVVIGVYLIIDRGLGKSIKEAISAFYVWLAFVCVAQIINILGYHLYFKNTDDTWNLFFVSPYYNNLFPILETIQKNNGWLVFFICYIIAFLLGGVIIWGLCRIIFLIKKRKKV